MDAGAQQTEGVEQVAGAAPILGDGVAGGHRQQLRGGVGEDAHDVGDQRLPGGVGVDHQVERDAEQAALGHVDVGAAHDHHQRLQQGEAAGADRLGQPMPLDAAGVGQGVAQRAGVEGVEAVQAAADAPHPPAEVGDQFGVFALDVAGDHGVEPERHQPGHQPFDDGGFPDAGLALHPGSGVGDQPGVQPRGRVEPDRLGGEQVLADRHPRRGGPGGRGEREQPAHLRGGALVGGARRDIGRPAAPGDRPTPGAGHRSCPYRRTGSPRRDRRRRRASTVGELSHTGSGGGVAVHRRVRWASSVGSRPRPRAAANPPAWAPLRRRSRSFAMPARCSTSAAAAGR